MKKPDIPSNEIFRLEELQSYQVLDTEAEEAFDQLTKLASAICQAPIALISLVDSDRQWFKSKVGLAASETPRELAFCAHAIHQPDLFIVPDSYSDERFADNPLVVNAPNVRFYAGAPLITPQGYAVGTLCVIDHIPRDLSESQREALEILRNQVINQLELRRNLRNLRKKKLELDQLSYALSHDLRSPLRGISSLVKWIKEDLDSGHPIDSIKDHLRLMEGRIAHASRLIDGMLSLAKVGKAQPMLVSCEIRSLIEGVCSEVVGITAFHLELPDRAATINVDRGMLEQALFKLVDNAVRHHGGRNGAGHSHAGDRGRISISYQELDKCHEFSVTDDGVGIDEKYHIKIFELFESLEVTEGDTGTGVGLTVARQAVEAMGGRITLRSKLGEGSTFTLTIPKR